MEAFSALLAICAGNWPITGEFPAQRPVTRSFDAFFDLRLNKRLSKQSWGWWFETLLRPLWRHHNDCEKIPTYLRAKCRTHLNFYGGSPVATCSANAEIVAGKGLQRIWTNCDCRCTQTGVYYPYWSVCPLIIKFSQLQDSDRSTNMII